MKSFGSCEYSRALLFACGFFRRAGKPGSTAGKDARRYILGPASKLALWHRGILQGRRHPGRRLDQRRRIGRNRGWSRDARQGRDSGDVISQGRERAPGRIKHRQELQVGIGRSHGGQGKARAGRSFFPGRRIHQRAESLHARKLLRRGLGQRFGRFKRAGPSGIELLVPIRRGFSIPADKRASRSGGTGTEGAGSWPARNIRKPAAVLQVLKQSLVWVTISWGRTGIGPRKPFVAAIADCRSCRCKNRSSGESLGSSSGSVRPKMDSGVGTCKTCAGVIERPILPVLEQLLPLQVVRVRIDQAGRWRQRSSASGPGLPNKDEGSVEIARRLVIGRQEGIRGDRRVFLIGGLGELDGLLRPRGKPSASKAAKPEHRAAKLNTQENIFISEDQPKRIDSPGQKRIQSFNSGRPRVSSPLPHARGDAMEKTRESKHFLNRELSWLEFNQRVLDEACDPANPLLERLKFFTIVSSNLDEFFEVRVAGLKQQIESGNNARSVDGLHAGGNLRGHHPPGAQNGGRPIRLLARGTSARAGPAQHPHPRNRAASTRRTTSGWTNFIISKVRPVLTPLAIDPAHPFPQLLNKSLNLMVRLEMEKDGELLKHLAVVQCPAILPRLIQLPRDGRPARLRVSGPAHRAFSGGSVSRHHDSRLLAVPPDAQQRTLRGRGRYAEPAQGRGGGTAQAPPRPRRAAGDRARLPANHPRGAAENPASDRGGFVSGGRPAEPHAADDVVSGQTIRPNCATRRSWRPWRRRCGAARICSPPSASATSCCIIPTRIFPASWNFSKPPPPTTTRSPSR